MLNKGYHAVGLQEILAEANVPKGSFYYYFKSKEVFGVAIIEHYIEQFIQTQRFVLADSTKSAREQLTDFFGAQRTRYLNQGQPEGCQGCRLVVKMANELTDLNPAMQTALTQGIARWIKIIADCIRQGVVSGEFTEIKSPEDTAEFIYAAWTGAVMRSRLIGCLKPYDLFVANLFEKILR